PLCDRCPPSLHSFPTRRSSDLPTNSRASGHRPRATSHEGDFMTLSDASIKNPVFAWMLMIGLIVFGWIGFHRMGISQLPDVDFPDRKSTRLNSSHVSISYAVFC